MSLIKNEIKALFDEICEDHFNIHRNKDVLPEFIKGAEQAYVWIEHRLVQILENKQIEKVKIDLKNKTYFIEEK